MNNKTVRILIPEIDVFSSQKQGWLSVIKSMTREERADPLLIDGNESRRRRVARGAAMRDSDVKSLIKQYKESVGILDINISQTGGEQNSSATLAFSLSIGGLVEKGFMEKRLPPKNDDVLIQQYVDAARDVVQQTYKLLLMFWRRSLEEEVPEAEKHEKYIFHLKRLMVSARQQILEQWSKL